jgi:hypothetical protein
MTIIDFKNDGAYKMNKRSFFVLGTMLPDAMTKSQKNVLEKKLSEKNSPKIADVWGTLGWEDDSAPKFKGRIAFSESGNFSSEGATLKVVKELYGINKHLDGANQKVRELFINFDDMKLGKLIDFNRPNTAPNLRLTIFLEPDEGAVAFIQHSVATDYNDEEAPLEFVMPEQGADDSGSGRDRMTFLIPLDHLRERSENLDIIFKTRIASFILKILTFKRTQGQPSVVLEQTKTLLHDKAKQLEYKDDIGDYIFGPDKYAILKYFPFATPNIKGEGGEFVSSDVAPIDFNKKTLLLVHGTFASVAGSFKHLYKKQYNNGYFLNRLLSEGVFEQIIAFNHPTVSENAQDNVDWFLRKIQGKRFTKPISILSSSRGVLVAKRFSSAVNESVMPIEKVLMFSGANGVGWFKVGKNIARGLSIMKRLSSPGAGKMILGFLQFSADFFLSQKACVEMTPGSKALNDLLSLTPQSRTVFLNVVSDWDSDLVQEREIRRFFATGLDKVIQLALGREHDWVVGTKEQRIYFSHSNARTKEVIQIVSMHSHYFDLKYTYKNDTHRIIREFLG